MINYPQRHVVLCIERVQLSFLFNYAADVNNLTLESTQ